MRRPSEFMPFHWVRTIGLCVIINNLLLVGTTVVELLANKMNHAASKYISAGQIDLLATCCM